MHNKGFFWLTKWLVTDLHTLVGESEGEKGRLLMGKTSRFCLVLFLFVEGQIDFQEKRQEMGKFVIMFIYTLSIHKSGLSILFWVTSSLWRRGLE